MGRRMVVLIQFVQMESAAIPVFPMLSATAVTVPVLTITFTAVIFPGLIVIGITWMLILIRTPIFLLEDGTIVLLLYLVSVMTLFRMGSLAHQMVIIVVMALIAMTESAD